MAKYFRRYRSELTVEVTRLLRNRDTKLAPGLAAAVVGRIDIETERPQLFSVKVCHDGVTAIRYDLAAALGAAIALVGGVVGANPVAAGAAVLACLLALKGVRREIADELAYILVALERRRGSATVSELLETLGSLGVALSESEVKERIIDLSEMGAVRADHGIVSLQERVIVTYRELN